jgi:hypothetical protein
MTFYHFSTHDFFNHFEQNDEYVYDHDDLYIVRSRLSQQLENNFEEWEEEGEDNID